MITASPFLRIPLSMIEHVDDLDAFQGLSAQQLAQLPKEYEPEEMEGIRTALQFAVAHPEYDFASMLPGLPHSNAEIHLFLVKIAKSMG